MAPQEIADLAERFKSINESCKSGRYNEAQVIREFVDPFLKALGWDIDDEQSFAEACKGVIYGPMWTAPPKSLISLFASKVSESSSWKPGSRPMPSSRPLEINVTRHDGMVSIAKRMLSLHEHLSKACTPMRRPHCSARSSPTTAG